MDQDHRTVGIRQRPKQIEDKSLTEAGRGKETCSQNRKTRCMRQKLKKLRTIHKNNLEYDRKYQRQKKKAKNSSNPKKMSKTEQKGRKLV